MKQEERGILPFYLFLFGNLTSYYLSKMNSCFFYVFDTCFALYYAERVKRTSIQEKRSEER